MLRTYKAILRGNQVEWSGDVDQPIALDRPVSVQITILDEPVLTAEDEMRGKSMATALEKLAAVHAVAELPDPAVWEREIRQDRSLPGRQE